MVFVLKRNISQVISRRRDWETETIQSVGKKRSWVQTYARIAGIIFLVAVVAGLIGEATVPSMLVVPGDPAATARNIVGNDLLFRLGFVAYIVEALTDVALTFLLYVLLRPVRANLAFAAVLFRVMATATFASGEIFYFAQRQILGGDQYLNNFTTPQLQTLALLSYNVSIAAGNLSTIFYGTGSIILGYLIWRSGYLPRIMGLLWVIGGIGFATGTLVWFTAPAYASILLMLPMIIALIILGAWLLVRGVNLANWREREPGGTV
ncbi:MAG TPA: DUF4386 domain-containing protein [Candidatus Bathyarchaeia archaeon]|nr:DUF4386 domain-containing protein [Candidatus Bathyarchaeia archaeon]